MAKEAARHLRIRAILGNWEDLAFDQCQEIFAKHLAEHLKLPCEVKGIEDFNWEEYYIIGPGDQAKHRWLRKTQPSFRDRYDLLRIELGPSSEWMLFGDDIAAFVRRRSDGREFWLGLSELEAKRSDPANRQLLDDYSFWFANCR